jgi:dihydropyrimidine dehydrogenase (NADP+)/dihydropyrimidine dehydrogenase (NAD+) subunit PreA
MKDQLLAFMEKHKFERLADFKGYSVQFFTTHADLVKRQAEARAAKKAEHDRKRVVNSDAEWHGEDFVKQTEALARG